MAREEDTPGTNLPGFSYGSAVTTSVINLLTDQASIVNDSWRRMKAGTFGVSDYMRGASTMLESYVDAMSDIVLGPFRADVPQWVNFLYNRKVPSALKRTVRLSRSRDPSSSIDVTSLHALNSEDTIPDEAVKAQFSPATLRRTNIEIIIDSAALKQQNAGEYIGFVYDRRASGGSPLVVILLTITT